MAHTSPSTNGERAIFAIEADRLRFSDNAKPGVVVAVEGEDTDLAAGGKHGFTANITRVRE